MYDTDSLILSLSKVSYEEWEWAEPEYDEEPTPSEPPPLADVLDADLPF